MYAYIKGTVEDVTLDRCIIGTGSIGYNIMISGATSAALPPVGGEIKLYTYTSVREDALELLGFLSTDDLNMFKQLISVSGVGPKSALNLMSIMTSDEIRIAIVNGDVKSLSKAPGVGKKSAERLIVDLKGKYNADVIMSLGSGNTAVGGGVALDEHLSENISEAVDALSALGFGRTEILNAIRTLEADESTDVDTIISEVLRIIR